MDEPFRGAMINFLLRGGQIKMHKTKQMRFFTVKDVRGW